MTLHRFIGLRLSRNLSVLLLSLHVVACGSGSNSGQSADRITNISWVAPTEREDGTPISLSEIAGYRVYYGPTSGGYTGRFDILDSSANETGVSDLPPGRYYIAVTTLDTYGLESVLSEEITIN